MNRAPAEALTSWHPFMSRIGEGRSWTTRSDCSEESSPHDRDRDRAILCLNSAAERDTFQSGSINNAIKLRV